MTKTATSHIRCVVIVDIRLKERVTKNGPIPQIPKTESHLFSAIHCEPKSP